MVFPSVDELSRRNHALFLLFGVATIGSLLLTIRALMTGSSPIQLILLGGLTLYALILTFDAHDKVGDLKHVSAIPLGIIGVVTFLNGHTTDLPIFFIILGVGSFLDLAWNRFDGFY